MAKTSKESAEIQQTEAGRPQHELFLTPRKTPTHARKRIPVCPGAKAAHHSTSPVVQITNGRHALRGLSSVLAPTRSNSPVCQGEIVNRTEARRVAAKLQVPTGVRSTIPAGNDIPAVDTQLYTDLSPIAAANYPAPPTGLPQHPPAGDADRPAPGGNTTSKCLSRRTRNERRCRAMAGSGNLMCATSRSPPSSVPPGLRIALRPDIDRRKLRQSVDGLPLCGLHPCSKPRELITREIDWRPARAAPGVLVSTPRETNRRLPA